MISVATYNVYLGADLLKILTATSPEDLQALGAEVLADVEATDFAQRAHGIAAQLQGAGWPDLVGCQEVCRWSTQRLGEEAVVVHDFTDDLQQAFAAAQAPYELVASAANFGGRMPVGPGEYGELLAHNVTFARRDRVQVLDVDAGQFDARIGLPAAMPELSFAVVRSWTVVAARIEGVVVRFANTHLETYDADTRRSQLAHLWDTLGSGPAVLAGDLNEPPHALEIPEDWADAWVVANGPAGGHTFQDADPLLRHPTRRLDQRIDYVLTRGLEVEGCVVIGVHEPTASGLWPSDHAGVVAVLHH